MTTSRSENEAGAIGRVYEDGLPVIYAFDNSEPSQGYISRFAWLAIVWWKYDGSDNDGMPLEETNARMIELEDALSTEFHGSPTSAWVFNRTGNNLKEFAYYISDRDHFIGELNRALASHARYPIEISFYDDSRWSEFRDLLREFGGRSNDA